MHCPKSVRHQSNCNATNLISSSYSSHTTSMSAELLRSVVPLLKSYPKHLRTTFAYVIPRFFHSLAHSVCSEEVRVPIICVFNCILFLWRLRRGASYADSTRITPRLRTYELQMKLEFSFCDVSRGMMEGNV